MVNHQKALSMPSATYLNMRLMDRSKETATCSFRLEDMDDDGGNWADLLISAAAVVYAVGAATEGNIMEWSITPMRTRVTNLVPSDGRREQKLHVRYEDATSHRVYRVDVPIWNPDAFTYIADTDFVSLTATGGLALKTALELSVLSPEGGIIHVISMKDVGRNN